MATVQLKNVSKSFGDLTVLNDIDLEIEKGEFVVLLGPSGCGKSTLLRCICGLEKVSSGELLIGDKVMNDVSPADRDIAMVFQSYALYPNLSVYKNIAFPLEMRGAKKSEIKPLVDEVSKLLGLTELLGRLPKQLSGGQRQRVAMGRALVRKPQVFLFDEPLSNLDAALRSQLREELVELHRSLGATSIYVTHDQVEAMTMADKIVVLNGGDILQVGSPLELYRNPVNMFVAGFIGSPKMNFLSGDLASAYDAPHIGIRPEHLSLHKSSGTYGGKVVSTEKLGADTFVKSELDDGAQLLARADGEFDIALGDNIYLNPASEYIHRFQEDGAVIN